MDDVLAIASRFHGGATATALVCTEILFCGVPILCVTRKGHVWQFLCGEDHPSQDVWGIDPCVTTVQDVVARDPSVAAVATMNDRHIVRRRSLSDPWVPVDDLSLWWM
jgi:hypothetical protein